MWRLLLLLQLLPWENRVAANAHRDDDPERVSGNKWH